jgi:hypothetical protein
MRPYSENGHHHIKSKQQKEGLSVVPHTPSRLFNALVGVEWVPVFPSATLQRHNTENLKHIFPATELRGRIPDSYFHVSVGNLYITTIGLSILPQKNRWTDRGNI